MAENVDMPVLLETGWGASILSTATHQHRPRAAMRRMLTGATAGWRGATGADSSHRRRHHRWQVQCGVSTMAALRSPETAQLPSPGPTQRSGALAGCGNSPLQAWFSGVLVGSAGLRWPDLADFPQASAGNYRVGAASAPLRQPLPAASAVGRGCRRQRAAQRSIPPAQARGAACAACRRSPCPSRTLPRSACGCAG